MLATVAIPPDWTRHLTGGRICLGYDVATTEKRKSNPSSITVIEEAGAIYWQRLVVRFKTEDPEASLQAMTSILDAIRAAGHESSFGELNVDSSNEKYHAQTVRKRFRSRLRVNLIGGGESVIWQGEKFSYKTLLGQLYVSAFEDRKIAMAAEEWLAKDHRLVTNHAGSFAAEVDEGGNHADTFDSGKLALWGFLRGGRSETKGIQPMQVGGIERRKFGLARRLRGSFRNQSTRSRLNG